MGIYQEHLFESLKPLLEHHEDSMIAQRLYLPYALLTTLIVAPLAACDGPLGGEASRTTPCSQTRALFFDEEEGWLGCAGSAGGGIYYTSNGGLSWTHAVDLDGAPTSLDGQSSRFNDIERGDDGAMYFCGGDNNTSPKIFLYRMSKDGVWETLVTRDTLLEGGGRGFSDCQNIAVSGDSIIIDDNAGSQVAYSNDGGKSWSKADVGQIDELTISDGRAIAAGGTTGEGPSFYTSSEETPLLPERMMLDTGEGNLQEARGLDTPDNGNTWLIAGTRDGAAGGWVKRSTDGGMTWSDAEIDADDVSFFEDLVCIESWCVAAGRRLQDDAGIAYESRDAGKTWERRNIGEGISPIYTARPAGDKIWLAGDGEDLLRLSRP
jgi:hypothetical protein